MTTLSTQGRRNVLATSADEPLLQLVEITHADLAIPARFVNDTIDITVEGNLFKATRFSLIKPDDVDQQTPQAQLSVDNIGRELTQWLEYSNGGKGAKCRLIFVMRSTPSVLEFDMKLDLTGISIDNMKVSGGLGFKNTLMQPAVAVRFDPLRSPGVF